MSEPSKKPSKKRPQRKKRLTKDVTEKPDAEAIREIFPKRLMDRIDREIKEPDDDDQS